MYVFICSRNKCFGRITFYFFGFMHCPPSFTHVVIWRLMYLYVIHVCTKIVCMLRVMCIIITALVVVHYFPFPHPYFLCTKYDNAMGFNYVRIQIIIILTIVIIIERLYFYASLGRIKCRSIDVSHNSCIVAFEKVWVGYAARGSHVIDLEHDSSSCL